MALLQGLQDEYVIAVAGRHARHLVRAFEPVDRAAGDVVRQLGPDRSAARPGAGDRRQHRRRAGALHGPVRGRRRGPARAARQPHDAGDRRRRAAALPRRRWSTGCRWSTARRPALPVNFHTAFNVVAALVFLPLTDVVAWACRRLLPDKPVPDDPGQPRHLDPERARFAGRGAGLRAARDAESRRPRGRHAAPDDRRPRAQRSPRASRQSRRPTTPSTSSTKRSSSTSSRSRATSSARRTASATSRS